MSKVTSISMDNLRRFCGTNTAHRLKKTFGQSISDLNIEETLSFFEVAGTNNSSSEAMLLLLGLYYSTNRTAKEYSKPVPFEKKLGSFYQNSTETTKKSIHNLLKKDFASDGIFARKFYHLCTKMSSIGYDLAGIDYPKLLNDLQHWNHPSRYVQIKWAKALFDTENEDTENNNNEESESI